MKITLLFCLLLLPTLAAAQVSTRREALAALMAKAHIPGMQVVYTKGGAVTTYSLGVGRAGTSEAITAATTFEAASLGKEVLAYVALRLHDRGLLNLDKPLLHYYAYPRLATQSRAARITARMVLTHTAGLPNWAENPLGATWATSVLSVKYLPDSCWNYSGEGFVFLQKTLEHLTGKSLETLAQEEVFSPLHLAGSSFVWRDQFAATACAGHDATGHPTDIDHFAEPNAGYSLFSTANDYSRFLQALMTGRGLKPATARLLRTPGTTAKRCGQAATATDAYITWAYGVGLATTSRGLAQWQWGDNGNFKNFFMTLPAAQETLVFFTNSANGATITDEMLQLFFGPGQYRAAQWLREE